MSWWESHLLRPASFTFSTLAGKACCNLSNFLRPSERLRWLRVLEEGYYVATLATSTTNQKQRVINNTWLLHMERHLHSATVMIEVTSRRM